MVMMGKKAKGNVAEKLGVEFRECERMRKKRARNKKVMRTD